MRRKKEPRNPRSRPATSVPGALIAAALSLALALGAGAVRAQEAEDEYLEEFDESVDESDFTGSDVYENMVGLDDADGLYKLDNVTAETFQKMTSMERENAIMKLQIEQERLRIDLEKQRAEKKKVATTLEDDERKRQLERDKQEKAVADERRKEQEATERLKAETEKKKRDEELNRTITEKIKNADLSNPDEVAAITQLMRMTSNNDAIREINLPTGAATKRELPVDEKYSIRSIIGAGGNLVANVENVEKKTSIKLRVGSELDGWSVESIKNSSILLRKDGASKIIYLNQ